jgi:acyl-CoA synthetase (AMP-forming)/AMP-acid ligase II
MSYFTNLPTLRIWGGGAGRETIDLPSRLGEVVWISRRIADAFPGEKRLGIIYSTCGDLPLVWLGALLAGMEPCLLQFPTERASAEYWRDSIRASIEACSLEGLIHGAALEPFKPGSFAKCLVLDGPFGCGDPGGFRIDAGSIIQLSSGTTGHRKGIRFSLDDLARHVAAYNRVMRITGRDTIVSWLPLYHDMGFIACFVMPLLTGTPLVLIDPIAWVRNPPILYEAIREHRGTISYLPNFGFEVMSRHECCTPLESMRLWISCSEPSYLATLDRFCRATNTDRSRMTTCYAMAENVFAVTQSDGLRSLAVDGGTVVSCGRPIPGVELKIVDGEVYVRSDTCLREYLGTGDIRDGEGFYPTGDIGGLSDGELYLLGRKRDVMISAGKKYFLNDFDHELAKHYPASAGRIASIADFNDALGTQMALFLIEGGRYWDRDFRAAETPNVGAATGLEMFEAHFVPKFFITKTSSGKINRVKTLRDWKAHQAFVRGSANEEGSALIDRTEFIRRAAESFAGLPRDVPVGESLDSLGLVVMRLLCEQAAIPFDPRASLDGLAALAGGVDPGQQDEVLSIVALVDGVKLGLADHSGGYLSPVFLAALKAKLGRRVRVEHFAVPPAPILFSDVIFHDYFMPREPGPKYAAFSAVIRAIKNASLILYDDEDSFRMLEFCVYPRLAYRFVNNPQADLLAHRLTAYTLSHHLLARDVVAGGDIQPAVITPSIVELERYLDVPIMKLAFHTEYSRFTRSWDHTEYRAYVSDDDYCRNPVDAPRIQTAIVDFLAANRARIRFRCAEPSPSLIMDGPPHFCSFLANAKAVDFILARHASFCIAGLPSSVPYIPRRLTEMGKPFFFSGNLNPQRDDYDCMLCTGFSGPTNTGKPYFEFMQIGAEGGRPRNVTREFTAECPPLVECDPAILEGYLTRCSPMMPVGNMLLNAVKRLTK